MTSIQNMLLKRHMALLVNSSKSVHVCLLPGRNTLRVEFLKDICVCVRVCLRARACELQCSDACVCSGNTEAWLRLLLLDQRAEHPQSAWTLHQHQSQACPLLRRLWTVCQMSPPLCTMCPAIMISFFILIAVVM